MPRDSKAIFDSEQRSGDLFDIERFLDSGRWGDALKICRRECYENDEAFLEYRALLLVKNKWRLLFIEGQDSYWDELLGVLRQLFDNRFYKLDFVCELVAIYTHRRLYDDALKVIDRVLSLPEFSDEKSFFSQMRVKTIEARDKQTVQQVAAASDEGRCSVEKLTETSERLAHLVLDQQKQLAGKARELEELRRERDTMIEKYAKEKERSEELADKLVAKDKKIKALSDELEIFKAQLLVGSRQSSSVRSDSIPPSPSSFMSGRR